MFSVGPLLKPSVRSCRDSLSSGDYRVLLPQRGLFFEDTGDLLCIGAHTSPQDRSQNFCDCSRLLPLSSPMLCRIYEDAVLTPQVTCTGHSSLNITWRRGVIDPRSPRFGQIRVRSG